jgi:hypothetical protein
MAENLLSRVVRSLMSKKEDGALSGLNAGCGEGQMISRLFQSGVKFKMMAMDVDPA